MVQNGLDLDLASKAGELCILGKFRPIFAQLHDVMDATVFLIWVVRRRDMDFCCVEFDLEGLEHQSGLQEFAGNATMLYYMTEESQEGKKAFLEKRKPDYKKFPKIP